MAGAAEKFPPGAPACPPIVLAGRGIGGVVLCIGGRAAEEIRKRPARKPAPTAAAMNATGQPRAKSSTSSAIMPSERVRSRSANCVISLAASEA